MDCRSWIKPPEPPGSAATLEQRAEYGHWTLDSEYDVVVIGSGAAGLSAALCAGVRGSKVLVLEKAHLVGGTTALSGGGTWIPCNHYMADVGASDSREEALEYVRAVAPDGWHNTEAPLWASFVEHAAQMLAFVETHSRLRFGPSLEPDPFAEAPGGKAFGRMVSPRPISRLAPPLISMKVKSAACRRATIFCRTR